MAGIRVVTDSSCDLSESLAAQHQITVVPLKIRFGEEELVDRRDLTPTEFWARCAASPVLPETAAPSPGDFEEAFRAAAADGATGVLCVNLSGKMSATGQAAWTAAQAVEAELPVRVADSHSVSLGLGMIAVGAARLAAEGATLDDLVAAAADMAERTRVIASLDTLENLRKGGRIGAAKAMLGSILSFKPVIEVRDGAVEPGPRQRTRSRALAYLVEQVATAGPIDTLAVLHGDAPDIEAFVQTLSEQHPRNQIVVGDLGAVVGAHTGPRTIGVTFQLAK